LLRRLQVQGHRVAFEGPNIEDGRDRGHPHHLDGQHSLRLAGLDVLDHVRSLFGLYSL